MEKQNDNFMEKQNDNVPEKPKNGSAARQTRYPPPTDIVRQNALVCVLPLYGVFILQHKRAFVNREQKIFLIHIIFRIFRRPRR